MPIFLLQTLIKAKTSKTRTLYLKYFTWNCLFRHKLLSPTWGKWNLSRFKLVIICHFCISESTEYCQPGEFSANCGPHDVLLVTSAQYGRMRLGKCVKVNYGSLGCAADVLSEMDRKCSGRHECTFDVDSLHGKQPCPDDLTPYLEATHECISGKLKRSTIHWTEVINVSTN